MLMVVTYPLRFNAYLARLGSLPPKGGRADQGERGPVDTHARAATVDSRAGREHGRRLP